MHDCLTEFDFSISCVPHLVAIAPGQFEEAAWEPEVSDIDGQFRRRHTFRSCVPCVARDVCVLVGPFSAHRAYRDTTIETVDPNALPINPFTEQKSRLQKLRIKCKAEKASPCTFQRLRWRQTRPKKTGRGIFRTLRAIKFLGRGVYDCMESFEPIWEIYTRRNTRGWCSYRTLSRQTTLEGFPWRTRRCSFRKTFLSSTQRMGRDAWNLERV